MMVEDIVGDVLFYDGEKLVGLYHSSQSYLTICNDRGYYEVPRQLTNEQLAWRLHELREKASIFREMLDECYYRCSISLISY